MILPDPTDAAAAEALARFAARVRARYGPRLAGLYLFGSRARGDHAPGSDADVAVVLADGDWVPWRERFALSDLGYDLLVEDGLDVRAVPFPASAWENPDRHANPAFARAARRDARPLAGGG